MYLSPKTDGKNYTKLGNFINYEIPKDYDEAVNNILQEKEKYWLCEILKVSFYEEINGKNKKNYKVSSLVKRIRIDLL